MGDRKESTSSLMQDSPGRKPDWLDDNKLFSLENVYDWLHKSLSMVLLQVGSKETGR